MFDYSIGLLEEVRESEQVLTSLFFPQEVFSALSQEQSHCFGQFPKTTLFFMYGWKMMHELEMRSGEQRFSIEDLIEDV